MAAVLCGIFLVTKVLSPFVTLAIVTAICYFLAIWFDGMSVELKKKQEKKENESKELTEREG